jgi:GNAT superfamily N-acetyltransferase
MKTPPLRDSQHLLWLQGTHPETDSPKQVATMSWAFREARLQAMWCESHPGEPVPADVASGRIRSWECVHDSRVVGHCVGDSLTGEILGLSVLPDYQGKDIAKTLLGFVVEWLRASGVKRIWLTSSSDPNLRAYGFYRALGWTPVSTPIGDGVEILELRLKP